MKWLLCSKPTCTLEGSSLKTTHWRWYVNVKALPKCTHDIEMSSSTQNCSAVRWFVKISFLLDAISFYEMKHIKYKMNAWRWRESFLVSEILSYTLSSLHNLRDGFSRPIHMLSPQLRNNFQNSTYIPWFWDERVIKMTILSDKYQEHRVTVIIHSNTLNAYLTQLEDQNIIHSIQVKRGGILVHVHKVSMG